MAGIDSYVSAKRTHNKEILSIHSADIKPYYNQAYWDNFNKALEEWNVYEVYPGAREEGSPFDED